MNDDGAPQASARAGTPLRPPASAAPWLQGVVPPVCTPLGDDLEVDTASLERLVGFLLDAGVAGLFVLGSSGEGACLTDAQRDVVVEVAVKVAGGQVPVLAGVIDMASARAAEHARRAVRRGAEAVVATAPFYVRSTHAHELGAHFRRLRAAAGVPLVAYDIPVAVQCKLDPAVVAELAHDGVLAGVKDSTGDLYSLRTVVLQTRDLPGFAVFTGSEVVVDAALLVGADGAVPGLANVDPHRYVQLYELCRAGRWAEAAVLQDRLVDLFSIVACGDPARHGSNALGLGGFKTALVLRGVISGNAMSEPMTRLESDEVARVRAVLERCGLV
jgi:4-hydroxy-tetrahydrodipicolinate synthase